MNWQVLYVHSRAEKKVADRLSGKGFETFCPMRTEVRQWSDRKKKVRVPYFRSYVFVRFAKEMHLSVLQTPGVVGFLYWLGKPAIIRETEMQGIICFFEDHAPDKINSISFEQGQQLLIKEGALREKQGIVLRQSKHKVVLQIQQLGVSLIAEVPKNKVVSVE